MASVLRSVKQTPVNGAFFVNVGNITASVLQNNGTAEAPLLSSATWVLLNSTINSSLAVAGRAFLRDMGVNLVSSGRTFRKVQMLAPYAANVSTGGVNGAATGSASDYLTGYIEVPGGAGNVSGAMPTAAVARV
jgi:hypothetical protein